MLLYGWQKHILSFKYFLNSWLIRSHRVLVLKCQGSSSFCPSTQHNLPPSDTLPPLLDAPEVISYLRPLCLHTCCSLCLENPSFFFHLSDFPTSFENLTILLGILPLSFICFPYMASGNSSHWTLSVSDSECVQLMSRDTSARFYLPFQYCPANRGSAVCQDMTSKWIDNLRFNWSTAVLQGFHKSKISNIAKNLETEEMRCS